MPDESTTGERTPEGAVPEPHALSLPVMGDAEASTGSEGPVRQGLPGGYAITDDPAAVDLDAVHAFLTASYWSPGIDRGRVARAAAGSLCATLVAPGGALVGFARAVTDRASFAYLADVFVLDGHTGRGFGRALTRFLLDHPDTQTVRRWMLATRDAHGVYTALGFAPLADPSVFLELRPSGGQFTGADA